MFAEDGAFELPYLATFGLPTEYRGRDAIAGFFQSVLDIYPGFQFENIKVLIDTPDQAFAEFEATAVSTKTGRTVHQLFFSRLVAENGKIKLLREALNIFEVARATAPRSSREVQDSLMKFVRRTLNFDPSLSRGRFIRRSRHGSIKPSQAGIRRVPVRRQRARGTARRLSFVARLRGCRDACARAYRAG
jgi:hypothetical protein